MFRLRKITPPLINHWIVGFDDEGPLLTDQIQLAHVYKDESKEFWEDDPDFEIVELGEDEIMRQHGQRIAPRLFDQFYFY